MENIEELENDLYIAIHGTQQKGNAAEIWNKIKKNTEVLREAVEIRKNKWNQDRVTCLTIAETMLIDYKDLDPVAYKSLIESIYTNTEIARIVLDGYSNGGCSFLLMSLWNHDLKLTEEQKAFAVDEAMNKIGTIKDLQQQEEYSKELEDRGITNDITTTIEIGGCLNPIGAKTKNEYLNLKLNMMSNSQAHGKGYFDIRYQILRNPNWTLAEKQKLIMDFWYDDTDYDEHLEQWEWGVVNDCENYKGKAFPPFDRYELFNIWTYEMLLKYYGNKETTDRIWEEIDFCKQMHKLRPQKWEKEFAPQKVLTQSENQE